MTHPMRTSPRAAACATTRSTTRATIGVLVFAALVLAAGATRAAAQNPTGLAAELIDDINQVESKVIALAEAMNDAQHAWRPGEGVRSTSEVLLHIAADNFFLTTPLGVAAPAATKIMANDYASVQAYEGRQLARAAVVAQVRESFEHLRRAVARVPESRMNEPVQMFGQEFTTRGLLIMATTHLHEHLGQLIAYARTNDVVPPWSR